MAALKIQLFEDFNENPASTVLYTILIRHKKIKVISDGKKLLELNFFWKKNKTQFKRFYEGR